MKKNLLLIVPIVIGFGLLIYSWLSAYPLTASSANVVLFYDIPIPYWVSYSLVTVCFFLVALFSKNIFLKWLMSVAIVITLYSLTYFYPMINGADSQFFRGLNEYFIDTKSLDASQLNHDYYQWPAFFLLTYISVTLSGINLFSYEFILFTVIGFLMSTTIFIYASRRYPGTGFLAVVGFFFSVSFFFNYQNAPFSLALAIVFVIFLLETREKTLGTTILTLILYSGLILTHVFVPIFYLLFLFLRSVFEKESYNINVFIFSFLSYIIVQFTFARFSTSRIIGGLFQNPQTYNDLIDITLAPVTIPLDVVAQFFSRTVTLSFISLCALGFLFLFFKKRLVNYDKALFFTGLFYACLGLVLNTLGWRAVSILFIPVSLGLILFFNGKFRKYFVILVMILLIFSSFTLVRQTFSNFDIQFQTEKGYQMDNFFLENHDFTSNKSIFTDYRSSWYLQSKIDYYVYILTDLSTIGAPDVLLFTPALFDKDFGNTTIADINQNQGMVNRLYDSGSSYILFQPSSP
jgi:hypothetical protein